VTHLESAALEFGTVTPERKENPGKLSRQRHDGNPFPRRFSTSAAQSCSVLAAGEVA
jgi:hypothetical protein